MTALKSSIIDQIARLGPMTVAEYMTQCLLHPAMGYYTTQTPLGAKGDFITAPEISQMFGELLGLALAQAWIDQGRPRRFCLCELGPGRGTLMKDVLRATKSISGFQEAAQITLVEASPKLRETQAKTIAPYQVTWADSIEELPDLPLYLIANEFFDCLPIRQFRRAGTGWQEQMIGALDDELGFVQGTNWPDEAVGDAPPNMPLGSILETSSASAAIAEDIARRITKGGVAIIIDYGDWNAFGDTFQALKNHQKVDVFSAPGQTDLTAHVQFSTLAKAAEPFVDVSPMITQAQMLGGLGISERATALSAKMDETAVEELQAAFHRLTAHDQMGQLFKAIAFFPKGAPPIAGFET